jgi:hypothetical protein
MSMKTDLTLDDLVSDLRPVRAVRPAQALALVAVATLGAATAVAYRYGVRPDIMTMTPHPLVLLRAGMLLVLGSACIAAVIASARPAVGHSQSGWAWALAAGLLFPVSALIMMAGGSAMPEGALSPRVGEYCLGIGGASALLIGGVLTGWLRRGAPTSLNRAGWLVGLTAGSFGTFVYSLHCPMNTIYFVGLWYTLAVGLSALVGRMIVPRLIRW